MDGKGRFFTDEKYNLGEGEGDIEEIRQRRTWPDTSFWVSSNVLYFGEPVLTDGFIQYRWNEYLYIGRTRSGSTAVTNIAVEGAHAKYFSLDRVNVVFGEDEYARIKVKFQSQDEIPMQYLDIDAVIMATVDGQRKKLARIGSSRYWQSQSELCPNQVSKTEDGYYMYTFSFGRREPGSTNITQITFEGLDAERLSVPTTEIAIQQGQAAKIEVQFRSVNRASEPSVRASMKAFVDGVWTTLATFDCEEGESKKQKAKSRKRAGKKTKAKKAMVKQKESARRKKKRKQEKKQQKL
jgi:hypothetical protein